MWSGMAFSAWAALLIRNRLAVSPSRIARAAVVSVYSALNSTLGLAPQAVYGRCIRRVPVPDDPLFIIGHWRTGTTMLHELLGLDERNRCPTTYECLTPCHFLISEPTVRSRLWFLLPKRRPMDNMKVSIDRPQEDETAMCELGARSPFLTVLFPNRPLQDPRYVDFDELTPAELARWTRQHQGFLQSILYKRAGRLVLKSPQHTFR